MREMRGVCCRKKLAALMIVGENKKGEGEADI
jgi:hypothetical protein